MKKHKSLLIFIIISVLASMFNYLTYPALSRLLPSGEFINTTISLSILTQLATFFAAISALVIGITKTRPKILARKMTGLLQGELIYVFVVLIIIFWVSSPFTLGRVGLPVTLTATISLMLLFAIPISVISGFLNGQGKLVHLSFVSLIVAILQLAICLIAAIISKSAAVALFGMLAGQIVAIFVILIIFRGQNLPKIVLKPTLKLRLFMDPVYRSLGLYAIAASIGVVLINLVQIVDLMIFKSRASEAAFYTDLYIISRVVFFSGAIFIWPFLSEINTDNKKLNLSPLLKFSTIIVMIGSVAITMIILFGSTITELLFESNYSKADLIHYGILSITLKCAFLILTALTLYFVVLGKRAALYLPVFTTVLLLAFVKSITQDSTAEYILYGLNIITLTSIGIYLLVVSADLRSK